jgi:predicted ATPase
MPVLLVATLRSEFQPPWTRLRQVIWLTLARLDQGLYTTIVEQIAGPKASLSREIVAEIVSAPMAMPLFLEELTKAVLENAAIGPIPVSSLAVPATLHASLIARLTGSRPIAKDVAQVGAAIERGFSYELLAATAQRTERELAQALALLVDAGLIFARGQRRRPPISSSMHWFRIRPIACCCGQRVRHCTRGSHARSANTSRVLHGHSHKVSRAPFHRPA